MYVFTIISLLTASIREFIIISSLIIIHEIGHSIMAYLLGIKIEEIYHEEFNEDTYLPKILAKRKIY